MEETKKFPYINLEPSRITNIAQLLDIKKQKAQRETGLVGFDEILEKFQEGNIYKKEKSQTQLKEPNLSQRRRTTKRFSSNLN